MLKPDDLKSQLHAAFKQYIPKAIEQCMANDMQEAGTSKLAKEKAKKFAKTFDDLVSEPLAESIAQAIDYYVKNAQIYGTIITVGSRFTQTATINSTDKPLVNGKVPNTLGIK